MLGASLSAAASSGIARTMSSRDSAASAAARVARRRLGLSREAFQAVPGACALRSERANRLSAQRFVRLAARELDEHNARLRARRRARQLRDRGAACCGRRAARPRPQRIDIALGVERLERHREHLEVDIAAFALARFRRDLAQLAARRRVTLLTSPRQRVRADSLRVMLARRALELRPRPVRCLAHAAQHRPGPRAARRVGRTRLGDEHHPCDRLQVVELMRRLCLVGSERAAHIALGERLTRCAPATRRCQYRQCQQPPQEHQAECDHRAPV